ncbi:MAG: hypothetical protein IH595_00365 [Bacteroidales bacterium]|nr:hypothetical protein [Bacteroidales bacterium]
MEKKEKYIWQEDFIVDWESVSMDNRMTLSALMRILLQGATNHAEAMGFGFTDTSKEDLSWVLLRINLKIDRLPSWQEKISVFTWPSQVKALTAFREFKVVGKDKEVLCQATSEWSVINLKTRRPQRMEGLQFIENHHVNQPNLVFPFPKINPKMDFKEIFSLKIHYSHIDMNGHANAVKYFDWLSDAVYEQFGTNNVSFVFFNYYHECMLGENISIGKSTEEPGVIRGFKTGEDKMTFLAKVEMR